MVPCPIPKQRTHAHSIKNTEKRIIPHKWYRFVWRIQKTHANNLKNASPQPRTEEYISPFWGPASTNTPLPHVHTASPRPLARTHDANTKRNRNRFPDWIQLKLLCPQSPICNQVWITYSLCWIPRWIQSWKNPTCYELIGISNGISF